MSIRHYAIILILGAGALVVAMGLAGYFRHAFRQRSVKLMTVGTARALPATNWLYLAALFAILLIAFLLRIEGIDLRGMSHVEVYIPGIKLPPLISEPPPRLDFLTMLSWHWHDEPHPQGYYFLMFFWTKLFGTSLAALRFPSVIFGVGAVALLYMLASMAYNRNVGLVSAGLLALNGHHIYWSQNARMYAMACFLALASAIFLFTLLRQPHRRPLMEGGYVLVTFLGVFTQLFFWPFLAAQMLLAIVYSSYSKTNVGRIFSLQVLVVILGSPLWAHAVYRSRAIDLGSPSLDFVLNYINFGFLFLPDTFSLPPRIVSSGIEVAATMLALVCLIGGLINRSYRYKPVPPSEPVNEWKKLIPIAAGFSLIIIALSILAWRRQTAIALTALVPLLALLALPFVNRLRYQARSFFGTRLFCKRSEKNSVFFFIILALLPALLLIVVSFFKSMMIARGFILFVPFLLVIQAAGVELVSRKRILAIPLLVILAVIHMYSVDHYRRVPGPNDYRGLSQQIDEKMEAGDLIFVYPKDWPTTPLFYYFQGEHGRIIAGNYSDALSMHPNSRVWIPLFAEYKKPSEEMHEALRGHKLIGQVSAHNITADLYAPMCE